MKSTTTKNNNNQNQKLDFSYLLIGFMFIIYPLIVIPNNVVFDFPMLHGVVIQAPPNYFYAPRYVVLALVAVLALFFLIWRQKISRKSLSARSELIPLALFFVFSCVAVAMAAFPQTAWFGTPMRYTGLTTYIFCIILFLLAAYGLNAARVNKLLRGLVIVAAGVGLLGVLQYYNLNLVPHEDFRANFISYGTMANPNFFGTYMIFVLPAAMLVFLQQKRSWFYLLCTALIYAGLLVSLTRGVWLTGLLIFLALAWYVFFGWGKQISLAAIPEKLQANIFQRLCRRINSWLNGLSAKKAFIVITVVFILVTAILIPARDGRLFGKAATMPGEMLAATQLDPEAGSQRMFIWQKTAELWLSRPDITLFGIGPDHLIYARIITPAGSLVDKTHNIYLEKAITVGGLALLAYLVFLAFVLRNRRQNAPETMFLLKIMVAAYLIQGFFNIETVMTVPLFWLVLGMIAIRENETEKEQIVESPKLPEQKENTAGKPV